MPLLAIDTAHGDVIDATCVTDDRWATVWRARTGDRLRCRGCGSAVIAKVMSATGNRFFAHSSSGTPCPSRGESRRHLALKATFAHAFRGVGWTVELEASGADWRADVLATDPSSDRRLAIEVQLSGIGADEIEDRTARHLADGVTTVWVVTSRGARWTRDRAVAVISDDNQVVDTVLVPGHGHPHTSPAVAAPASIGRFVQRVADGRLSTAHGETRIRRPGFTSTPMAGFWQLDSVGDEHISWLGERDRREQDRRAKLAAERDQRNAAIAVSLQACRDWVERELGWKTWFRGRPYDDIGETVVSWWEERVGIAVLIGRVRPEYVLALAEPQKRSSGADDRVAAWTTGKAEPMEQLGYPLVFTPESVFDLDPFEDLKVWKPKRKRR